MIYPLSIHNVDVIALFVYVVVTGVLVRQFAGILIDELSTKEFRVSVTLTLNCLAIVTLDPSRSEFNTSVTFNATFADTLINEVSVNELVNSVIVASIANEWLTPDTL